MNTKIEQSKAFVILVFSHYSAVCIDAGAIIRAAHIVAGAVLAVSDVTGSEVT